MVRGERDGRGAAVTAGVHALLTAWLAATLLAQHPQREFDAVRRLPGFRALLPDWRFFAPRPVVEDLVPVVTWIDAAGRDRGRTRLYPRPVRRPHHAVWFPEGRRVHAVLDLCREITLSGVMDAGALEASVPVTVLRLRAEGRPEARGQTAYRLGIVAETPWSAASPPRVVWVSPVLGFLGP